VGAGELIPATILAGGTFGDLFPRGGGRRRESDAQPDSQTKRREIGAPPGG
jgi:hypothetical protein